MWLLTHHVQKRAFSIRPNFLKDMKHLNSVRILNNVFGISNIYHLDHLSRLVSVGVIRKMQPLLNYFLHKCVDCNNI